LRGEIYPEHGKADIADQFAEPAGTPKEVPAIPAGPWLREHLVDRYVPAWHQGLPDGGMDQAIGTTGLSRMHNYYLEGLSWLIRELGVDGLYLDGIGYDRQVMKRVRKVMDRARPGCLLDFHSGNNYHPTYGLGNPMALYMELLPSIDSLWFGEGFDYENSEPDYFMTEICGLPFGLSNDMLQEGGNPWRGMIYGMACRFGWMQGGDPRHLWALWDSFGISQARMFGYWHRECPVRTDQPKVLATAYVKPGGSTLISVASWAAEPVTCHLVIDWAKLGLDRQSVVAMTAPAIRGFQEAARFELDAGIPVEPKRGWLLVLEAGSGSSVAGKGLSALPDGLTLTCDGMECGRVKVELTGPDVVVEVKVHDVAMSRNARRPERGSCCELFVSPGLAEAPYQLMFLPAVGSIPAEVHAYRNGQSMVVPSGLEWSVQLEPDGYRLVMRAARSSFGMASDATEFYFDCAAGVTEPLPYWVRTRVQLAGARYPFAKSDALLRIVA
jgi:hypothetical protein